MSKYDPLHDYLTDLAADVTEKTFTFEQVEEILGADLPDSAYKHREWWANPSSPEQHSYAQSWLTAGWKVDTVNQTDEWVRFVRSVGPTSLQKDRTISEMNMFAEKALSQFARTITDEIFLLIQNDPELMQEYLSLVSENGKDAVNRAIGKRIKVRFGLENLPSRGEQPRSTLIKSYQQFE